MHGEGREEDETATAGGPPTPRAEAGSPPTQAAEAPHTDAVAGDRSEEEEGVDTDPVSSAESTEGHDVDADAAPRVRVVNPARDLARGRPTRASSSKSEERDPSFVVDGRPGTRWTSAYEDDQWIAVDLGAVFKLDRVQIRWERACAEGYLLQGSSEADIAEAEWATLAEERGHPGWVVTRLPLGSEARWVRMYGQRRATEFGFSIWELSVYADLDEAQPPPPPQALPQVNEDIHRQLFGAHDDFENIALLMQLATAARQEARAEQQQEASGEESLVPPTGAPGADRAGAVDHAGAAKADAMEVADNAGGATAEALVESAPLPAEPVPRLMDPLTSAYIPPAALKQLLGENPCSICFELLHGYAITITACGHIFHARCLRYSGMSGCPICRGGT